MRTGRARHLPRLFLFPAPHRTRDYGEIRRSAEKQWRKNGRSHHHIHDGQSPSTGLPPDSPHMKPEADYAVGESDIAHPGHQVRSSLPMDHRAVASKGKRALNI